METSAPLKIAPNTMLVEGRIAESKSIKRGDKEGYATIFDLPAPDEFSRPQTVDVLSIRRLGSEGEIVKVKVQLLGYRTTVKGYDGKPDWKKTTVRLEAID